MDIPILSGSNLSGSNRCLAVIAAANGFLAVSLGAFAAHGLQAHVSSALLPTWHTGVRYHMFHVLAALIAIVLVKFGGASRASRWAALAGWLFLAGILLFCGSLYLLVLAPQPWLVMTAPLGGTLFLLGWVALTGSLLSNK